MEVDILNQNNILNSSVNPLNENNNEEIDLNQNNHIDQSVGKILKECEERKKEEEEKKEENEKKEKIKNERISSVPSMMRCYICEDFCDCAVQIMCCNEIFCEKHITEEIMKNFACPRCKKGAGLQELIENKKLRENIIWYKGLLNESIIAPGKGLNINISQFVSKNIQNANNPNNNKTNGVPSNLPHDTKNNQNQPQVPSANEGKVNAEAAAKESKNKEEKKDEKQREENASNNLTNSTISAAPGMNKYFMIPPNANGDMKKSAGIFPSMMPAMPTGPNIMEQYYYLWQKEKEKNEKLTQQIKK